MSRSQRDIDLADVSDLVAERNAQRRYHRAWMEHPDPRDPDHPGPAPRATPLTPQQPKGQK